MGQNKRGAHELQQQRLTVAVLCNMTLIRFLLGTSG